ncbi:Rap1a/Tai family immunity protein [Brenneria sp. g21c3]|uniref:Rap1a/Tai family immunity protein n=1 Tax=Brenneria sp. g21c3 TaxID=3093893 RepID=UPI002EBD10DC|nr:Rap1a/Tai family immunity protein [Brenneria sp. g21c3]
MVNKNYFLLSAVFCSMLVISPLASANQERIDPALIEGQISRNDVNLSGTDLLRAWTAQNDNQARQQADMYLLGVLDATEGKSWCSYNILKSITLEEIVFSYFKKLPAERLQERASRLIEEALIQNNSCKERRK